MLNPIDLAGRTAWNAGWLAFCQRILPEEAAAAVSYDGGTLAASARRDGVEIFTHPHRIKRNGYAT